MDNEFILDSFGIDSRAVKKIEEAEAALQKQFRKIDEIAEYNQYKVIAAFRDMRVSARHFMGTTGYGNDDDGREKLGEVFASIFKCDAAIVSPLIASGTHAIAIGLFGLLRPLDTMLSITGEPYDTLATVIGLNDKEASGSLKDFAINFEKVDLQTDGSVNIPEVLDRIKLNPSIKIVYLQRSRGYEWRKALSIAEIERAIKAVKEKFPNMTVVVDNCYGEFTETREPAEVGADLIIGSLIKNPGGGFAYTGGYLAGTEKCIDMVSQRLTAPGIGSEVGSYIAGYLAFYQGIYMAPSIVKAALKGATLTSYVFSKHGYEVSPDYLDDRSDITQAIRMRGEDELITLIRAVQKAAPIDSYVVPYPSDMPGYESKVIMAAGTFMQGGSIELSADAPMRKPYTAYVQGGMTYENAKLALMIALTDLGLY